MSKAKADDQHNNKEAENEQVHLNNALVESRNRVSEQMAQTQNDVTNAARLANFATEVSHRSLENCSGPSENGLIGIVTYPVRN